MDTWPFHVKLEKNSKMQSFFELFWVLLKMVMYLRVLEPKFGIKLDSKKLKKLGKTQKKAQKLSFYKHLD